MAARIALFDLGGVILDWSPERLYSQIFSDSAECERFLTTVCTMDWHTQHDAGVSFEDNAAALTLIFPQYESQIRAWRTRWTSAAWTKVPPRRTACPACSSARCPSSPPSCMG